MRCPYCNEELVDGASRKYETLEEHVSNPNRALSVKPTWVCKNSKCILNEELFFWDFFGENYNRVTLELCNEVINLCHNKSLLARDSFARQSHVEIGQSKRIYSPAIFNRKLSIKINYKGDKEGNKVGISRIKISSLVKKDESWLYKSSGIKMFFYVIGQFRYHKKRYMENQPPFAIERIISDIKPIDELDKKDNWKIWAKRWIRFRYKKFIRRFQIKQLLSSN